MGGFRGSLASFSAPQVQKAFFWKRIFLTHLPAWSFGYICSPWACWLPKRSSGRGLYGGCPTGSLNLLHLSTDRIRWLKQQNVILCFHAECGREGWVRHQTGRQCWEQEFPSQCLAHLSTRWGRISERMLMIDGWKQQFAGVCQWNEKHHAS